MTLKNTIGSVFIFVVLVFSMFVIPTPAALGENSQEESGMVQPNSISSNQISSPQARISNVNPITPRPSVDDINVVADVIAPAGVDSSQVDLISSLRNIEDSRTVVPMTQVSPVDTIPSNPTFSTITEISQNKIGVDYSYVSDYITFAEVVLRSTNAEFKYWEIEYYNLQTGEWLLFETAGNIDGSEGLGKVITLDRTGTMGGFRFHVILEGSQQPTLPSFENIRFQSARQYITTIPAINQTIAIDYFLRGVDNDGTVFFSQNNTLFVNNKPLVTAFNNLPSEEGNLDSLGVNVTVQDLDGISTVQEVIAYYRMESQYDWQSSKLENFRDINTTHGIFDGVLDLSSFDGYDENMEIYVETLDTVQGIQQVPTSSAIQIVSLDNLGPVLLGNIQFSANPFINNSTLINETISMDLTLTDTHGVSSAIIGIKINNQAENQTNLFNTTILNEDDMIEDFNFLINGYPESTVINYRLITEDFIGNTYVSDYHQLFVDNDGPIVSQISSGPEYPSNSSGAEIVYNIYDNVGTNTQSAYYTIDGTSWVEVSPTSINYQDKIIKEETQSIEISSGNLVDKNTTRFDLNVNPTISADEAIVVIDVVHQRITDLQYYLEINGNISYLVADRSSDDQILINLGDYIDIDSLGDYELTLVIADVEDELVGTVSGISVKLIDYSVPLGYDYSFNIPPQQNDTTVTYYFHLVDNFGFETVTGNYSIYLDAIPPVIQNYTIVPESLDLEGSSLYQIDATLSDRGGIGTAEIWSRSGTNETWIKSGMTLVNQTGMNTYLYSGSLSFLNSSGLVEYYIRILDNAGWGVNSSLHSVAYENANAPVITLLTNTNEVMDLEKQEFLTIEAQVTDDNKISEVTIYYRFDGGDFQSKRMFMLGSSDYQVDIPVNQKEGDLEFYIVAEDEDGQSSQTPEYSLSFENSGITSLEDYYPWIAGVAVLSIVAAGAYYLYRRNQKPEEQPSRLRTERTSERRKSSSKKKKSLRADSILIKRPK